jgi:hypothetical protein
MIAAVLGSATNGLAELATLRTLCRVDAVFAVNDAAADYAGPLAAFVTLHPEHLSRWLAKRLTPPAEVISHEAAPGVTCVAPYQFPGMNASGSSGLFAVKIALERFEQVVLCGVPMDASRAHYFDAAPWTEVDSFWDAWRIALPHLVNVRSMSGRTAQLLGMPTREFLTYAEGISAPLAARR